MPMITMDSKGLTRCAECDEDLKNMQQHFIDKHNFPDHAIVVNDHVDIKSKSKSKIIIKSKISKINQKDEHHQQTLKLMTVEVK